MGFKSIGVSEGSDQQIAFDEDGAGGIEGDVQLGKVYYGPEGTFNNDFASQAKQDAIIAAIEGLEQETGTEHRNSIPFGSVGSGYSSLLNVGTELKYLLIQNYTDKEIVVSFDGSNDYFQLARGKEKEFNFGSNKITVNKNVQIKHAGASPTAGAVYALAYS